MRDDWEPERFGVIDTSTHPFEYFRLQSFPFTALSLQHISIFMVMVTLSMTLKTYLHINLLCHNILSFFKFFESLGAEFSFNCYATPLA